MSEADSTPISVAAAAATVRRRAMRLGATTGVVLDAACVANVADRRFSLDGRRVADAEIVAKIDELIPESGFFNLNDGLRQLKSALKARIEDEAPLEASSMVAAANSIVMSQMPSVSL